MWLVVTPRPRQLVALALALIFVLVAAAAPPDTVLTSPGPDQIAAASDGSSTPGDRGDRLSDAGTAATPTPLLLPARTLDGRLLISSERSRCPRGHRDRVDRPPRTLA
jgi:hypothetical protein